MADHEGIDFFGTYIPTAEQAAAIPGYDGVRLPTPIEDEFGAADPRVVGGIHREFGGADARIKQFGGLAVPHEPWDLGI